MESLKPRLTTLQLLMIGLRRPQAPVPEAPELLSLQPTYLVKFNQFFTGCNLCGDMRLHLRLKFDYLKRTCRRPGARVYAVQKIDA
jgi:hypothetical protein